MRARRSTKPNPVLRAAVAACALFALAGCAIDNGPETALNWPVATYYTVVVRPGDRVDDIASRYNVSASAILRMNELHEKTAIYPGEILRIPPGNRATRTAVLHDAESSHVYVAAREMPVKVTPLKPVHNAPTRVARNEAPVQQTYSPAQRPQTVSTNDSGLRFIWPVAGGRVIDNFGANTGGERNDGINIAAPTGTPIRAAQSGTVTYAGNELRNYGNLILIRHDDGYITAYAHADHISVSKGQHVEQGEVVGTSGATGDVSTPQVHFEIRRDSRPVDPRPLMATTS
jgi:murein DD-endopeptidase MepM/ murein hydrolase activator NlpD